MTVIFVPSYMHFYESDRKVLCFAFLSKCLSHCGEGKSSMWVVLGQSNPYNPIMHRKVLLNKLKPP